MEQLPENLLFRTFLHLRARALDACRLVCKRWASIINSQVFQKAFQDLPTNQRRLVFSLWYDDNRRLRSFSPSPPHLEREPRWSFGSSKSSRPPTVFDCVHGLICHETTIINPSLGMEFDIPLISPTDSKEHRILGFDPISFCHKLLALKVDNRTGHGDYRVHTLGDDPKAWRMVSGATPKLPRTQPICIEGMVYYFTVSPPGTCSMAIFDVATETIEFFSVPDQASHSVGKHLDSPNKTVLEYHGKFGFVSLLSEHPESFGLWVLDDVEKQLWTKLSFSLYGTYDGPLRYFRSINLGAMSFNRDTGEIVLVATGLGRDIYLVFIDVDTNKNRLIPHQSDRTLTRRGFAIREYRESTVVL